MSDVAPPDRNAHARRLRALVSAYENNRDLVLMGAYRAGADPLVDRAIALQPRIGAFLSQEAGDRVPLAQADEQLAELIGDDG
jgi:flagellum-specific ATP synthase